LVGQISLPFKLYTQTALFGNPLPKESDKTAFFSPIRPKKSPHFGDYGYALRAAEYPCGHPHRMDQLHHFTHAREVPF